MRVILFRAKRMDDGEWVEGDLSRCIAVGETHICRVEDNLSTTIHPVDPETVCQYTGLSDKKGKKIFEGDIVKICTFGFEPEVITTQVIYDKCAFRLKNGRNMFYYGQSDFSKMDDAVVIANIFDNPDMKNGKEDEGEK